VNASIAEVVVAAARINPDRRAPLSQHSGMTLFDKTKPHDRERWEGPRFGLSQYRSHFASENFE